MKVLFINRENALSLSGGDTIQMFKTKEELEKKNIEIQICLGKSDKLNYSEYDFVHLFNIQTDKFSLREALRVKKYNSKLIVSPIWWDFEEDEIQDIRNFGPKSIKMKKIIGSKAVVILKKINLKIRYLRMKRILKIADIILPNSDSEKKLIIDKFGIDNEKVLVVNNGVSEEFIVENQREVYKNYALQVGRIEECKKTHLTIRACKELKIPLVIIGKKVDELYYQQCLEEAKDSEVKFWGFKSHDELIESYRGAKVHILPSLRETPGLVSLEAASQGCNIVSTEIGSASDYFRNYAFYCNPYKYSSIKRAINEGWNNNVNNKLKKHIVENFTWEIAAIQTLKAYELLSGKEKDNEVFKENIKENDNIPD